MSEKQSSYDFVISRSTEDHEYGVWRFDPDADNPFAELQWDSTPSFDRGKKLAPIGGYLLAWESVRSDNGSHTYPYRLFEFDPDKPDPLNAQPVKCGVWSQEKFWGAQSVTNPNEAETLELIPLASFVLSLIPAEGRGTFELWNFDPMFDQAGVTDPLPEPYRELLPDPNPDQARWFQGAFPRIQSGHILLPMGNYVLDRLPENDRLPNQGQGFRVWSFDPESNVPLSMPTVQEGTWDLINASHQLVPIGDWVLDWVPGQPDFRVWKFDPDGTDPLVLCREGRLPPSFDANTRLTGIQPTIPAEIEVGQTRGTIGYMRKHIKHVVYYMLESRSFDNVCGWLYENGEQGVNFVGSKKPYQGASTAFFNLNSKNEEVHVSKFNEGQLDPDVELNCPTGDPVHGNSDSLLQMFASNSGYEGRQVPNMGGFIWNTGSEEVMQTLSPEQLPILNGLAEHFGVSDEWFSSVPGGTDINRAYSLTGSAFNRLSTFEGNNIYKYWPKFPHRQSIWKVLWSNGIKDWKIYYSVKWLDYVFTYQLYLQGQIPTVDANPTNFLSSVKQFKEDARTGNLPQFSYLEPVWIAPTGSTSYHPSGDLVPGEVALNEIYDALRQSPKWDETLLIITFDKNNSVYDHVPPPYAKKAWPNDLNDGFHFDLMGPRVPTILVSPWIKENTVFRAEDGKVPYDSTSFPATLLNWYGIPMARWGLGDRITSAPTFENVIQEPAPRQNAPTLTPPYDNTHPKAIR